MGGATGQPGGGVKEEGEGEVVVDNGNVDGGEGQGVYVVDPPHAPPPPPPVAPQSPGPPVRYHPEGGGDPLVIQVLAHGCAGDQRVFSSPARSLMTVMWIFRRLIWCLIRQNEREHRGTSGKDASNGGGSGNPSLVPPCPRPPVWEVCPH